MSCGGGGRGGGGGRAEAVSPGRVGGRQAAATPPPPLTHTLPLRSVNAATRRGLDGVQLPEGARFKVQPFGSFVSGLSTWNRRGAAGGAGGGHHTGA